MTISRSYSELASLETFEERFEYLVLGGTTGVATFGFDRYLNQAFYRSREWRDAREAVILRDSGLDLGVPGHEIFSSPLVHHMNPMVPQDITDGLDWVFDPEYLITTTAPTHNAIHYGDRSSLPTPFVERVPNDTKLW